MVEEAEDFIYISTESFTDIDFSALLSNIAINKGNDIKILTVPKSMDFTDRVNSMLKDLLSRGVDVRASDEDLHAKLLVTDKMLEVGSINLNKINLGFDMPHKCWRENTETLLLLRDHEIIKTAKAQFLNVFSRGHPVRKELTEKLEKTAKDMFAGTFGLNSKKEAKNVFAKFMLEKQIKHRVLIDTIGKITQRLTCKGKTVKKDDVVSAIVLLQICEGKSSYEKLREELDKIGESGTLQTVIDRLLFLNLIEKEDECYRVL